MSDPLPNKQDFDSELKKAISLRTETGNVLRDLMAQLLMLIDRVEQVCLKLNQEPNLSGLKSKTEANWNELEQTLQMLTGLQGAIEHSSAQTEEDIFETKLSMTQNPIVLNAMTAQLGQQSSNLMISLEKETDEDVRNSYTWNLATDCIQRAQNLQNGLSILVKNIYTERTLLEKLKKFKESLQGESQREKKLQGNAAGAKVPDELCHPKTQMLLEDPVVLIGGDSDSFGFSCERKIVEGSDYVTLVPNLELKKVIHRFKQNGLQFYASDKDLFMWEIPFIDIDTGETFEKMGNDKKGIPNESLIKAIDRFKQLFGNY